MMARVWSRILSYYGQKVTLRRDGQEETVRAILQPILGAGEEQEVPTPLGRARRDRFLYLGPAGHLLDEETVVEWNGGEYRVRSAQLAGWEICPHWWAMLYPRDEVTQ